MHGCNENRTGGRLLKVQRHHLAHSPFPCRWTIREGLAPAVVNPGFDNLFFPLPEDECLIGAERWAKRYLERMPEDRKCLLTAYAEGVNRAIARRGARHFGRLGRVWGEVVSWTPVDSLSAGRIGGSDFGWLKIPALTCIAARLGREAAGDIMPSRRDVEQFYDDEEQFEWQAIPAGPDAGEDNASGGSNAWAIAPKRSASGHAMLAADPHVGFTAPGLFYLAALCVGKETAAGLTIPSIPAVIMGANRRVAWGATNGMAAQSVLYREELTGGPPDHYSCDGEIRPLRIVEEEIEVRFSKPVIILRLPPVQERGSELLSAVGRRS
ncbi:penicillin acylase family protein [Acidobacteriota bacterium]